LVVSNTNMTTYSQSQRVLQRDDKGGEKGSGLPVGS
jgi:hypothetical protein